MSGTRFGILLTFCFGMIYCYFEVVPERIELAFTHPDHIVNASAMVKRYGRRSPYYITGKGILKQTWNNNVTVHVDTHEHLHNEYRLSFMTIHEKLCDLMNKDILMGNILRRLGFVCPVQPGVVELKNSTFKWDNFPYKLPFSKAMANMTARKTASNELLMWVKLYFTIKQHRNAKP
ncbi:uncharacterized protein LOC115446112 [Manduca sexta]|uniref:Uncharacterized protein n=1 Tax=Manduca sexta TaxID=7130 RepID=A0A922CQ67_MANSE|nr:uncharacterized protein LOC115446112 [Manduca sexta]KAG6454206.1 hypothetical protein O3G_MSEX008562 [Manduca sexta]